MKDLKKISLLVGFILMSLNVIFHVHIGYIWMLIPFIIFVTLVAWPVLKAIGALGYSFSTKGWTKTMEILEENSNTQKRAERISEEAIERCMTKLLEK